MASASGRAKPKYGKKTTALDIVADMDLGGKTFFITGANSGIGFETARALALHGAHVVMGCRNPSKAQDAKGAILKEKPDAKVDMIQIDNSSLQSVHDCAQQYIANGWPLHCLILNAGAYNPQPRITADGFEATFQTNHLAHFLLTNLLTPLLITNAPSRVVVVSSDAHKTANVVGLTPEKITWEFLSPTGNTKMNGDYTAYSISKLCNVLHAKALHERLASKGVTVNSLHPGMIRTNIQNNSKFLLRLTSLVTPWMKTVEQGAATTVYCAVAPELTPENGGLYYDDCRLGATTRTAQRADNAEKLWALSEEMLKEYQKKKNGT